MARRQSPADHPLSVGVLALLAEGEAHPYALAAALKRRGLAASLGLNAGVLYRCFRSLVEMGWVESLGSSRPGQRPPREAFRLTDLGRTALRDQLRRLLAQVESPELFRAGLAFLGLLTPEEAVEVLRERAWIQQRALRASRARYRGLLDRGVPRGALLDLEYPLMLGESEVVWLRRLTQEIEARELDWGAR